MIQISLSRSPELADALATGSVVLPHGVASCMGGWCKRRDECSLYRPGLVESMAGADPDEDGPEGVKQRLCEPGMDGVIEGHPLRIWRGRGTWERELTPIKRLANPWDGLLPPEHRGGL